jgi:subtilase family serine protease
MSRNPTPPQPLAVAIFAVFALFAPAETLPTRGQVIVPPSTAGLPGIPRTSLYVFVPEGATLPMGQPAGETPASIACIYGLTKPVQGCPINGTTEVPTGGSRAIAVIEYGHYPQEQSDLDTFSQQFGLPPANFEEVCFSWAGCPDNSGLGWDLEEALDLQWAHAMAPNAKIYAVETGSVSDLYPANQMAGELVARSGGGEVANTWLEVNEPPHEEQYDKNFKYRGVVYLFSAGDWLALPLYPSTSPFVVSVGGTTLKRDSSGNFTGETCWNRSGGAISREEARPAYQDIIKKLVGSFRGTPDMSFDGDPQTGVAVYSSSYCGGWCITGGTSVGSPSLAGVLNSAGTFYSSTDAELSRIYKEYGNKKQYHEWFRDITTGSNGSGVIGAKKGWDECTGVGSVVTYTGK